MVAKGKRGYAVKRRPAKKAKKGVIKSLTSKDATVRSLDNSKNFKFMYSDTYTLNPGVSGVGATQVMRLSSLHDPDFTGVGHQPLHYDQIYNMYERYQVYKVDFEVVFASAVSDQVLGVAYRCSDKSDTSTDPRLVLENGLGEFSLIGGNGGIGVKSYRGSVNICDIHGVTARQYMANDDYGAAFGSNPTEEVYLHLFVDGADVDQGDVKVRIRLTYHAKLMGSTLSSIS